MPTFLWPLLSILWGVSEPDRVLTPPPPPLPIRSEAAVLRDLTDWLTGDWPFRASPLCEVRARDDSGAVAEIDAAVLQELQAWSKAARPARTLRFEFERFVYDAIAGTESHALGSATCEGALVHVQMRPPDEVPSAVSFRRGRDGRPLRRVAAETEVLTSDGRQVGTVAAQGRRTRIAAFPPTPSWPETATTRPFWHVPALRLLDPFYEFDAGARTRAYRISFGPKHEPGRQIHFVLVGTAEEWQREFDRVEVLLSAKTYEPMAILWVETGAIRETVYVYRDVARK